MELKVRLQFFVYKSALNLLGVGLLTCFILHLGSSRSHIMRTRVEDLSAFVVTVYKFKSGMGNDPQGVHKGYRSRMITSNHPS